MKFWKDRFVKSTKWTHKFGKDKFEKLAQNIQIYTIRHCGKYMPWLGLAYSALVLSTCFQWEK